MQHRRSATATTARSLWLGAFILLLGLGVVVGRALADGECGDTEPPKASKGKCPAGYKYCIAKKSCVKVSWSGEQEACIDSHSTALTDQDFYSEAVALADEGQFK